eukprot:15453129-Alexandrium_andersonii.AAC.1
MVLACECARSCIPARALGSPPGACASGRLGACACAPGIYRLGLGSAPASASVCLARPQSIGFDLDGAGLPSGCQ